MGKKIEEEKLKKERRKNLWKRLGFKLRVFNIFANKISHDPTTERLIKLKRKLGDLTIDCDEEASRYQNKIEDSIQSKLGFHLKAGDTILTHFDNTANPGKEKKRRKSKVFQRTHSFDENLPKLGMRNMKRS